MTCNKEKTALYCRVASSHPYGAGAIDIQRDKLLDFAKCNGLTDFEEYLDNGYGGNTLDRPGFTRMNDDIKAGKIGTVVVKDEQVKLRIKNKCKQIVNAQAGS